MGTKVAYQAHSKTKIDISKQCKFVTFSLIFLVFTFLTEWFLVMVLVLDIGVPALSLISTESSSSIYISISVGFFLEFSIKAS